MRHQTTLLKAVASFIRVSVGHGDAGRKLQALLAGLAGIAIVGRKHDGYVAEGAPPFQHDGHGVEGFIVNPSAMQ